MAKKLLIIGAGGVGRVAAVTAAGFASSFSEIMLASRTKSKCDEINAFVKNVLKTDQVDADNPQDLDRLFSSFQPDIVLNVALPYQDLTIMDACLRHNAHYIDTANYEPKDVAKFEYKWQWAYRERFEEAGLMALLGSGFDPGVTNVFCAYALKHHFDTIEHIDILDCNAGDHGLSFATNFNPEINIREITQKGKFFENGNWVEVDPMSISRTYDFPGGIGEKKLYLLYHEELESLAQNIPGVKSIRFWMTFSESYLTHLRVLEAVGMTSISPVQFQGHSIVPIEFLKALLPDPASLGPRTKGKTCIGIIAEGLKNGQKSKKFIYNICDHQESFQKTGAQAISFTTGVPAAIGAKLLADQIWMKAGVVHMEQMDPDPFMQHLNDFGLPWTTQTIS